MTGDGWRQRFLVASLTFPEWAPAAPDRIVYASDVGGSWDAYAWDRAWPRHRPVTCGAGTTIARPSPDGSHVYWFGPGGEAVLGGATRDGFEVHAGHVGRGVHRVVRFDRWARVAAMSRDGRLVAVEHCEHGDDLRPALRVLRFDDGGVVAELWDGPGNSVFAPVFSPVPGDPRLALLCDRTGRSRPAVVDPCTGERTDLAGDLPGDVDLVDWWPDGRSLVVLHTSSGRDDLHRVDLATGRLDPLPHPPGTIAGAAVRPDGDVWYLSSSGRLAPAVRVVGRDEPVLEPPGPGAPAGAPYVDWTFANPRGDAVHGFLVAPAADPPHPTVFLVHGGPHTHDSDRWNPHVQAFVDHGWAVALVNYRGSSGYGRAWMDALVGDPGRQEVEDVVAGRDDLVRSGFADPRRVAVVGSSWGGYVALLAAGMRPEGWCAAVGVVPVADWPAAYEDQDSGLRSLAHSLFGGPPAGREALYRERSPMTYADRVEAPVLVCARRNDTRCPLPQVLRYVDRLRSLGKPVELELFDGGHTAVPTERRIRQTERVLDFLAAAR